MMPWKLAEDYLSCSDKGLAMNHSSVQVFLSKSKNPYVENYFEAGKATACLLEALNN
jgi:hypothetical protein